MAFEWDEKKNRRNIQKHGISFEQAQTVFAGEVITVEDDRFDYGETRFLSIGLLEGLAVIAVVHTDRNGKLRIISARPATRKERRLYDEALR